MTKTYVDFRFLEGCFFFLDGVSFMHMLHPINTCGSRAYGKKGKGLRMNAKGRKEDVNGRTVHSFVAIAYGKGVVMREQFLGKYSTFQLLLLKPVTVKAIYFYKIGPCTKELNCIKNCIKLTIK